jgi:5-formyltetrahydrofolate cyclo-ligase
MDLSDRMNKEELRKLYSEKRMALSPRELERFSESVCHLLFSNFRLDNKTVSLFLPIERKKELNTYMILEKALSFDAKVAVPKVNADTGDLKHIMFENFEQLETSKLGIPEPQKGRVVAAEHFDIVFVPLLAVDQHGNRVGYGEGFYDRFLSKCSPRTQFIGLSHFPPIEESFENVAAHDIRLHGCISAESYLRFN